MTLLEALYAATLKDERWRMYFRGLSLTLQISLVGIAIGVVLGIAVAMVKVTAQGSKNPVLRTVSSLCTVYTTIIRGTPLMIQLLILYGFAWIPNGLIACFIGFGINSGAYMSETFRSGIQSVDGGQLEAARSLGLTRWQAMRSVILPQAVKNMLPAIFNEFIVLVKETSVAGYIAVNELTKLASNIRTRTYDSMSLYLAAIIYLLLTYILTQVLKVLERRFSKSDRS